MSIQYIAGRIDARKNIYMTEKKHYIRIPLKHGEEPLAEYIMETTEIRATIYKKQGGLDLVFSGPDSIKLLMLVQPFLYSCYDISVTYLAKFGIKSKPREIAVEEEKIEAKPFDVDALLRELDAI